MTEPLLDLPAGSLLPTLRLAAGVIELASELGPRRWGLTYFDAQAIRVNVGWTEILTADRYADHVRLVVDGSLARAATLPPGVRLVKGYDPRGYYPSVPGSVLAEIPYRPGSLMHRAARTLAPALRRSVELAGRRRAGKGVRDGHNQWAVRELGRAIGRQLPTPRFGRPKSTERRAVPKELSIMEGALKRVVSSRYERDPRARRMCVDHYGWKCSVCGFSFERVFGTIGRAFIHVHHLRPMSEVGERYRIDPVRDLRPVCPNCHAMLHSKDPPFAVEELRGLMKR